MRFRYSRQARRTAMKWVLTVIAPLFAVYYGNILTPGDRLEWSRQTEADRLDTIEGSLVFGVIMVSPTFLALYLWWPDIRGALRRRRGLCGSCAYDRRGLAPDAKCPECGTVPAAGSVPRGR